MSVYIIIIVLLFLDLLMEESSVLPVINVMFGDRVLLPCSNVSQLSSDQVGYSLSLPPSLPPILLFLYTHIHCSVPLFQVVWLKDGSALVYSERHVLLSNGDLVVVNATYNDTGNYTCQLEGTHNIRRNLDVRGTACFCISFGEL